MAKVHTKETAEALLRELPSVLGAFVREDVNGHPREVHLLIAAGPEPRHLAIDVREMLEERLGVPVDQRVISIAQLADEPILGHPDDDLPPEPPEPVVEPRLRFESLETQSRDSTVVLRVRLGWRDQIVTGECTEMELPRARLRAAAVAALHAASFACGERVRFQFESIAVVNAFGREYALVTVLASARHLGRRPVSLAGAQPLEDAPEQAAALAALKAVNRMVARALA